MSVVDTTSAKLKEHTRLAVPNKQLLGQLLEAIQPIDFRLACYPESLEIAKAIEVIKPNVFLPDGSYNQENSADLREYTRLQKKLSSFKVTRGKYAICILDEIARLAKERDFGLCKHNGSIFAYNGCFWSELKNEQFMHFLGIAAVKMGMDKFDARLHTFRELIYAQFISEAYLEVMKVDKDSTLINLLNGTYEVSSKGESNLREFRKSDFLTHQLPFNFNPDAKCPMFNLYLAQVLPDVDKQKVLSEFSAYVFVKSRFLKMERILILYGTGSNGKSLFFEVLNALLGKHNVSNYSLKSLTDSTGYSRSKIGNKLLNFSSELSSSLDVNLFKQLTSGEPVECRLPYGEPYNISEYAKLAANTNQLPKDTEMTAGFFRRWLIIHFDQTIPPENQDLDLTRNIIENELSGVFNWILLGLDRLLKQRKFSYCKAIDDALNKYRIDSDSVLMFLNEYGYEKSLTGYTPMKRMYGLYRDFSLDNGYRAVNLKNFRSRLESQGAVISRKNIGNVADFVSKSNTGDASF